MDIKVNDFSFGGMKSKNMRSTASKISGLLLLTALGLNYSCKNNSIQNDYFIKNTENIAVPTVRNNQSVKEDISNPLKATGFFPRTRY